MKHANAHTDFLLRRNRFEITVVSCFMGLFVLCACDLFVISKQTSPGPLIIEKVLQGTTQENVGLPISLQVKQIEIQSDLLVGIADTSTIKARGPTLDIMCRTFNGALFEILRFILSYLLFFPRDVMQTQIIFVFDAENELDHMTGSILETAYKDTRLKVFFEEPPPLGTFTSLVRDEGYSRTQWSNFYSDLYSSADFIGLIDSDTEFAFRPSIEKHLILNWSRPVIFGIFIENCPFYPSVKYMIGVDAVAEFMYVFPFIVKLEHFSLMRKHIVKTTGLATFELAWREMQQKYSHWGQFSIMGNYLYHFHHSEYAWDIIYKPISTVVSPCPHVGKNLPMHQHVENTVKRYHHQMCVQSRDIASECKGLTLMDTEIAKIVPFTDYWPIEKGVNGHDFLGYDYTASKSHDATAPRPHQEIFDERIDEIHANHGQIFWYNTRFNTSERTKNPTTIIT